MGYFVEQVNPLVWSRLRGYFPSDGPDPLIWSQRKRLAGYFADDDDDPVHSKGPMLHGLGDLQTSAQGAVEAVGGWGTVGLIVGGLVVGYWLRPKVQSVKSASKRATGHPVKAWQVGLIALGTAGAGYALAKAYKS